MKKILSIFLSVVLMGLIIIPAFSVTSFASFSRKIDDGEYFNPQLASMTEDLDGGINNYTQFRSYVLKKMANCETNIDISSFKIPLSQADAVISCVLYDLNEAFHKGSPSYSYSPSTGCLTYLSFSYIMTKEEYAAAMKICDSVTESFIADLRNNNSLSQAEKALLVHDRIAMWCEYDYQNSLDGSASALSHEMYGTLVDGISLCSGYSRAYQYALRKLGIECYLCNSDVMAHEWNIVVIDGQKYHVDVSWDDPVWDVYGRVNHDNFLRSTNGIIATGHKANDFDTSPVSTTYDNYFWQNSNTEFQYKNGKIYYFDSSAKQLKKIENGKTSTLLTVSDKWKISGGYYNESFVRLDSDDSDNCLFYSTPASVYKYNLDTNTSSVIYTPDKPGEYYWIYGFKAQDNYFCLNINNSPNFSSVTYANNIKYKYQESTHEHTHKYTAVVTKPTCTEKGYTTYTCSCGDRYVADYVDAIGHIDGEWKVTKPATSTEKGVKTLYCKECGKPIGTKTIPIITGRLISVSIDDVEINYKESATIKPEIKTEGNIKYTVKYESSDPKIATVDQNGNIRTVHKGTAKITCIVTDEADNVVKDTKLINIKFSFSQWLIWIFLFGFLWY